MVWLKRALCGVEQALRAWKKRQKAELTEKGFEQSDAGPLLCPLRGKDRANLAMFFVDNRLVGARTTA
jgi:hypothetical protein